MFKNGAMTGRARSASLTGTAQPSSALDEERQLQMALAMSKQEHEAQLKQKQAEEAKIALAIEESKKEVVQVNDIIYLFCYLPVNSLVTAARSVYCLRIL